MKPKLLIIGLDGATLTLIKPWAEQGHLPNLNELMRQGTTGILRSTILPITATAWASFCTGVNPGKHGLYDFSVRERNSYQTIPINGSYRKARTFWEYLAGEGVRSGIINVPGTYPPETLHGFMVTGMLTPSTEVEFTYPPALARELRGVGYRILFEEVYSGHNEDELLRDILETAFKRREALLHLIGSQPWDIFFTVLPETDNISHFFWGFMDPGHPYHDPDKGKRYGDVLRQIYQQADETIGHLLAAVPEKTMVMIMSDHGSGPLYKNLFLNNYFIQHGVMRMKRGLSTRLKQGLQKAGFTVTAAHALSTKLGLSKKVHHAVGFSEKQSLARRLLNVFLSPADVDWARTQAYSMGNYGQVYLNLKGREPQGIVEPGEEYEEVRDRVIELLQALTDPESGTHIIETIYRAEEIYHGPYAGLAPDIVFLPTGMKYMTSRLLEFASSRIVEPAARHRTGGHTMDGVFILRGPGVRQGHRIEGARLIDAAPTILHLYGAAIPRDMDGDVLLDVFEPGSPWTARVPRRGEIPIERGRATAQSDEDDQELIKERLRGLGYLA